MPTSYLLDLILYRLLNSPTTTLWLYYVWYFIVYLLHLVICLREWETQSKTVKYLVLIVFLLISVIFHFNQAILQLGEGHELPQSHYFSKGVLLVDVRDIFCSSSGRRCAISLFRTPPSPSLSSVSALRQKMNEINKCGERLLERQLLVDQQKRSTGWSLQTGHSLLKYASNEKLWLRIRGQRVRVTLANGLQQKQRHYNRYVAEKNRWSAACWWETVWWDNSRY